MTYIHSYFQIDTLFVVY